MAKNTKRNDDSGQGNTPRGTKSAAISSYLKAHNGAMPKEVVAALKKVGVKVSPNTVSIIRAKAGVKKARRQATQAAADHDSTAVRKGSQATALEAALTLYKAARGMKVSSESIRKSFLTLFSVLG